MRRRWVCILLWCLRVGIAMTKPGPFPCLSVNAISCIGLHYADTRSAAACASVCSHAVPVIAFARHCRRRDHRPPSKLPSNRLICGADCSARRVMAHHRPADGEQANASSYGCPAISGPYRNTALQFPTPHRVATHVGEPSCLWRPRSATSANSRKCAVLNIRR
jgi:hypothetical protein